MELLMRGSSAWTMLAHRLAVLLVTGSSSCPSTSLSNSWPRSHQRLPAGVRVQAHHPPLREVFPPYIRDYMRSAVIS
jgi:hypothetical protein